MFLRVFYDRVLYLRRKRKREVNLEQMKKIKFMVVYHHGKLNILPSIYQLPLMNFSKVTVNLLLENSSNNVTPLWNFTYKEVNHTNNGMIMWNMMKCIMSEVQRVDI